MVDILKIHTSIDKNVQKTHIRYRVRLDDDYLGSILYSIYYSALLKIIFKL